MRDATETTTTTETTATDSEAAKPPVAAPKKKAPKKNGAKKKKAKTAAKKPAKPAKGAAKGSKAKKEATTGQSGPPISDLSYEKLNERESKVITVMNGKGEGPRESLTITELAAASFPSQSKKKANSWVRNQLRRLVCGSWAEKVERGKYRITEKGRKRLSRVDN